MTRFGYIVPAMAHGRGILEAITAHESTRWPDVVPVWSRFDGERFVIFPDELARIREAGMQAVIYAETGTMTAADILAGKYDVAFAKLAIEAGPGTLIRFLHEPNGTGTFFWQAWAPFTLVACWRHIADILHAAGARTIWCVSVNRRPLAQWWPGAKYVDVMAFDRFSRRRDSRTPADQARGIVRRLRILSATLPIWWCESGRLFPLPNMGYIRGMMRVRGVKVILIFDYDIRWIMASGEPQHDDWRWDAEDVAEWDRLLISMGDL